MLVTGGTGATPLATSELFDPATNAFRSTGSLVVARTDHQAVLLPSSKVLVLGGGGADMRGDLYDPASGSFAATADAPFDAASTNLLGDDVLFSDGQSTAYFHATLGTFELGPPLLNNHGRSFKATSLASGSVVFTGGLDTETGGNALSLAEIFDGQKRTVTALPSMKVGREYHSATRLPGTGKVLVISGVQYANARVITPSAEILAISAYAAPCTEAEASACEGDGKCVDGVCCEAACDKQCQSCNEPGHEGTCVTVTGAPRGARTACAPPGNGVHAGCAQTCDGTNALTCVYPGVDKSCDSTCADATLTGGVCDGAGLCAQAAPRTCENHLVCADATACKAACAQASDCSPGFLCGANGVCSASSQCTDNETAQAVDRHSEPCAPYTCDRAIGTCNTACKSVDDCVAPTSCNSDGVCVFADSADGGCDVSSGASSASGWLLAIATAVAVRRRRRSVY